ncbi:MAG: magnesium transporter, partial [Bacteroidota bacterium]
LITHLPADEGRSLLRWLPEPHAAEVLPELEDDFRAELLETFSSERISTFIDALDTDDAADVLADLPDEVVAEVLPELEDEDEIRDLLRYDEESAGGIMETDYVSVSETMTVAEATEEVRRLAEEVDPVYVVYVVAGADRLVGVVSLKKLLLSAAHASIRSIMEEEPVYATPELDQEDIARLMERYDLVALPVVDDNRRLVGRITIDDVVDVIREEAEEDIQRMSGTQDEEITASVLSISKGRLIWLLIGLVGALLSGLVIKGFEDVISQVTVLAMFIPVVMAMAGNAGIQSSSIAVQGLASGDLWTSDLMPRIGKELAVSLVTGAVLAVVLGLSIWLLNSVLTSLDQALVAGEEVLPLVLTAALALFIVIILATTIGATVPLLLDRFSIDPALATGPFITTSNDILGLIVYFWVATLIFPGLG